MKKFIVLFFLFTALFLSNQAKASDTLIFKNGTRWAVWLNWNTIHQDMLGYKRAEDPNGPTYLVDRTMIAGVKRNQGGYTPMDMTRFRSTSNKQKSDAYWQTGPRIGGSIITQGLASYALSDDANRTLVASVFGWQLERRYWFSPEGNHAIFDMIATVTGSEYGKFIPGATLMMGYRNRNGLEMGIGPVLSGTASGLGFNIGTTLDKGGISIPIDLMYVLPYNLKDPREAYSGSIIGTGHRISILMGFNYRRDPARKIQKQQSKQ